MPTSTAGDQLVARERARPAESEPRCDFSYALCLLSLHIARHSSPALACLLAVEKLDKLEVKSSEGRNVFVAESGTLMS